MTDLIPKIGKSDWVDCPVCGEPDMRKATDNEGNSLIFCVNHGCLSNGGATDELSALRERVEALEGAVLPCDVTVAPATVFRAGVKVGTLLDCIEDRRSALGTDIGGGRG